MNRTVLDSVLTSTPVLMGLPRGKINSTSRGWLQLHQDIKGLLHGPWPQLHLGPAYSFIKSPERLLHESW